MSNPSAMPVTLRIVLVLFAVSAAFDVWVLAAGDTSTIQWIRLAVAVGAMLGLWRGSESARVVVRALAVLGILGVVIQAIRLAPVLRVVPSLGVPAMIGLVVALLGCVYTFWALGREHVLVWMARRALRDA